MKFSEYPFNIPDVEKIKKDLVKLISRFKEAQDAKAAARVMRNIAKYMEEVRTDATIISVRFSQDTTNEEYIKAREYLDQNFPYLAAVLNEYNSLLVNSPFRAELEKTWGAYYFEMLETSLKIFNPSIISKL